MVSISLIKKVIDAWHHLIMNMPHAVGASNQITQSDISIHENGKVNINQYSTAIVDPTSKTVVTGLPLAAPGPAASAAQIAPEAEEADADGKEAGNVRVVPIQQTGQGDLPFMHNGLVLHDQYKILEGNSHMRKNLHTSGFLMKVGAIGGGPL